MRMRQFRDPGSAPIVVSRKRAKGAAAGSKEKKTEQAVSESVTALAQDQIRTVNRSRAHMDGKPFKESAQHFARMGAGKAIGGFHGEDREHDHRRQPKHQNTADG